MDAKGIISSLFGVRRALIGAIHTGGLPGTQNAARAINAIAEDCAAEARMYAAAGFHEVIIENTHDRPYLKGSVGPEITAALAVIGNVVRRASGLPLGVQILAAANQCALAVAQAGRSLVRSVGRGEGTMPFPMRLWSRLLLTYALAMGLAPAFRWILFPHSHPAG